MSKTLINLDQQAVGKTFAFGATGAGQDALVTINKGTAAASTVVLDVKGSQNIGGDLNLTGNLNITGSINEQSVTNLAVADVTITMNKGGTTPSDDTAGIIVEGTSAAIKGAIYYNAASATKFSIGDGTTQVDIVGRTSTQTLTNKTLTAPVINSPTGIVKGDVGLGNVANVDTTNAANISSGTLPDARISSAIARSGANTDITSVLLNQTGLVIKGATSVGLTIKPNETLTAGRTLNIITGDTSRSLTFTSDASIGGTNTGDISLSGTSYISLAGQALTASAINLTSHVTGILPGANGGTGNGFFAVAGPAASLKTFTFPNASASVLTDNAAVTVAQGGTGVQTFTAYAVILGGTTSTGNLQQVSGLGTSGYVLTSNGAGAAPTWQVATSTAYFRATAVSGTQDSSNKTFTIGNAVSTGSEIITINGQVLTPGSSNDYVISGTTVTFQSAMNAPASTDVIRAYGVY